ncbi:hypothetical protein HPP92_004727 [Vanilla planifolia]|uniref:Uncharacterized protein n=1 Tax=Vanilla planifolia TaxID=51239 RepID=A0A835RHE4_VANPL|nr:hypothetical protein HPP92_004727 [Vanilla planifolia]
MPKIKEEVSKFIAKPNKSLWIDISKQIFKFFNLLRELTSFRNVEFPFMQQDDNNVGPKKNLGLRRQRDRLSWMKKRLSGLPKGEVPWIAFVASIQMLNCSFAREKLRR